MSTINKTFLRVLLAIACCIALAFSLLPQAEAAMRADVVTAKVTLNGQVIDNKNAMYPLLSYSNITYFPMTYQLSRFMGVETDWNNAAKRKRANSRTSCLPCSTTHISFSFAVLASPASIIALAAVNAPRAA